MRTLASIAILVTLVFVTPASATDVSGDQYGTWALAQSPYHLVGDVRVPPGETLVVEPGVEIIGDGHYRIEVDGGTLLAIGTADQPILMTATDHSTGWRGLRLFGADDASEVKYCVIEYAKGVGDYPEVRGGAIFCRDCSPTIWFNELRFNYSHNTNYNGAGGGVLTESSNALITNNYFHDNIADSGAGVCTTEYGSPEVSWNTIVDNTAYYAGGGMYFGARSSPTVDNNIILRNSAGGWGGGGINSWTSYIYYSTFATVRNNIIAQNRATSGGDARGGGGVYCRYDRCILTGNTIVDNEAPVGGGIYALNYPAQAPVVANAIIWGNTASTDAQIHIYPGTSSAIDVSYSDVEGGWGGVGNISDDPRFVDPEADDYHLSGDSPCIDTGDPTFLAPPYMADIDGDARVIDGNDDGEAQVDMGADEFDPECFGDLDGDGTIGLGDLAVLLAHYGVTSGMTYDDGDLDGDGGVTLADLAILLAIYGTDCP